MAKAIGEQLPTWATRGMAWVLGLCASAVLVPLLVYAVSGVSDLKGDKKANDAVQKSYEQRLDRMEKVLDRISDAVGAKKP